MAEIKKISKIIEEVSPYYKKKGGPEEEHTLVYESSSETLEPIYFFIVDLMNDFGLAPEKLIDTFTSSPGSGHFSELSGKKTAMQQQGAQVMANINAVLKSVLNIVYDLKDFKTRLQHYNDFHSSNKDKNESALLALKQVWMDKVDISKGNSSLRALATTQAGFVTLIDAFLLAKDVKDVDKLDLNERVKRIVSGRVAEFNIWLEQSEKELKKRYEIERAYLKGQVNNLKLYSRWAKPYLIAASQLEMKEAGREPALVKAFNTLLLELTLLGKSRIDVKKSALEGKLPDDFQKLKTKRDYYACILVDFNFRGIPQRLPQQSHYVFGGRAEITFRAYALNSDELKKINAEIDKSDLGDVLKLIEGSTEESLKQVQDEIDYFLNEESGEKKKEEKSEGSNPFLALIGYYNKKEETSKKPEKKGTEGAKKEEAGEPKPDDWIEKTHLRPLAASNASDTSFQLFDIYKKAHGMASYT